MGNLGRDMETMEIPMEFSEYDYWHRDYLEEDKDRLYDSFNFDGKDDPTDVNKYVYINNLLATLDDIGETRFTRFGEDDRGGATVDIQGSQPKPMEAQMELMRSGKDDDVISEDIRSLAGKDKIDQLLDGLNDDVREITERRIQKIKIIYKKVRQISGKQLTDDAASVEIVNRSRITKDGTIQWRYKKKVGILGDSYYQLLMQGSKGKMIYTTNKNQTVQDGVKQFKELVKQIGTSEATPTLELDEQSSTSKVTQTLEQIGTSKATQTLEQVGTSKATQTVELDEQSSSTQLVDTRPPEIEDTSTQDEYLYTPELIAQRREELRELEGALCPI